MNVDVIAENLPSLVETLGQFEWKGIYNMNETGLSFRMQLSVAGSDR